jgi:hypothetical protein
VLTQLETDIRKSMSLTSCVAVSHHWPTTTVALSWYKPPWITSNEELLQSELTQHFEKCRFALPDRHIQYLMRRCDPSVEVGAFLTGTYRPNLPTVATHTCSDQSYFDCIRDTIKRLYCHQCGANAQAGHRHQKIE